MNRAFIGAWRKGYKARLRGYTIKTCPYPDLRKADNSATWLVAFRNAWISGYNREKLPDEPRTHSTLF